MNILKDLTYLLISVSCVYAAKAADLVTTNKNTNLPAYICGYMINPGVREEANKLATSTLRVAYLASVIASNAIDTNSVENYRKSSAIRLLGVINSTNAIPLLVSNITFVDAKYREMPALDALEMIGQPSVPYLLDALRNPTSSPEKVERVYEVLRYVKRARYNLDQWEKFVKEEEKIFPPELRSRIDRKIWVND